MKVLLLEDIKSLGKKGDIKEVSDGYAKNFLIPKNKVLHATPDVIAQEERRKKQEKLDKRAQTIIEAFKELEKAKILKSTLEKKKYVIKHRFDKNTGKAHESVTKEMIFNVLHNEQVDKKDILLDKHIRETGTFIVNINLFNGIQANIEIEVEAIY